MDYVVEVLIMARRLQIASRKCQVVSYSAMKVSLVAREVSTVYCLQGSPVPLVADYKL